MKASTYVAFQLQTTADDYTHTNALPCAHCSNKRYWRYKNDPKLVEHGCVPVYLTTKLTDEATDVTPEFKPFIPTSQNIRQMQTDPRGVQFVLHQPPNIDDDPGVEPWKRVGDAKTEGGDGWNREKLMRDVLKIAEIEKFTAAQVAEWNALFDFRTQYQTADSVPPAPIHLHASDGRIHSRGLPFPLHTLWSTLRGRFPRAHLSWTWYGADDAVCPESGGRHVSWLAWRNWSNDPDGASFEWPDNPTFDAPREADGRRFCQSFEPLNSFLPLPVQLTFVANYDPGLSLTHWRQSVARRTCYAAAFSPASAERATSAANKRQQQHQLSSGRECSVDSRDDDSSDEPARGQSDRTTVVETAGCSTDVLPRAQKYDKPRRVRNRVSRYA
eukprot:6213252-Pleurochrysis_carterae.AAC.2